MKNIMKDVFFCFTALSLVVFSSGLETNRLIARAQDLGVGDGGGGEMTTICHYPEGNSNNPQTLDISTSALGTHLAQGDTIGQCPPPPPQTVTIKANKIVCDSEEYAPNMSGGADINSSTAQTIVDNSQGHCHFAEGWEFQWGKNDSLLALSGDFVGKHINSDWHDFGSVTGGSMSTPAEVTVNMGDVPSGNRLWFREVLKDGYIPFSFPSTEYPSAPGSDVSAEFWCNQDVLNYDNAEWIDVSAGNTYYCVGINVLKKVEPPVPTYAPWCSALLGIVSYAVTNGIYNDVADINNDGFVNLSDVALITQMYNAGNDANCYQQFENPEDQFHFTCRDYTNIGWCQGLLQGVKDSIGSHTGDSNYSDTYDLNNDGAINLSDVALVAQLVGKNDQAVCYAHYVPPFNSCIEEDTYAPWCSALLGVYKAHVDSTSQSTYLVYNDIADIDNNQTINGLDLGLITQMYNAGNDANCYQQFENPEGTFHFSCENYATIGWCQGLFQGVQDSLGAHTDDPKYSAIYDLDDNGVIDGLDLGLASQAVYQGDQAACYVRYMPPMLQCPAEPFCGNGIIDPGEQCDGGDPVACTTEVGAYAGTKSCNMRPVDVMTLQSVEPSYCVFNPCVTQEYCGDEIKNGNEECDAGREGSDVCTSECTSRIIPPQPQPPRSSGGGGGGGVILPPNAYSSSIVPACKQTTINWYTSNDSITWLVYGTDQSYGKEVKENLYKTSHSVVLADLLPGTTYYYQIKTQGSNGLHKDDALSGTFVTPTTEQCASGIIPQVLGTREVSCNFVKPDGVAKIDADILTVFNFPNGALIRSVCDPNMSVYIVVNGKKFHIPSWAYLHENYFSQRIFNVDDSVLNNYPTSNGNVLGIKIYLDGTLLRGPDKKVYIIKNSRKRELSAAELKKYASKTIIDVNSEILSQY